MIASDGFEGSELALGTVHGVRHFNVDRLGRLTSPFQSGTVWKPGENVATCEYTALHKSSAPGVNCSCGFYAYWDGHARYFGSLKGAIEMYGRCIIGTKGVRAEKAKIAALVIPYRKDNIVARMNRGKFFYRVVLPFFLLAIAFFIWGCFAIPGDNLSAGQTALVIFSSSSLVLGGATTLTLAIEGDFHLRVVRDSEKYALIRRNYPDIKIFRSVRAMNKNLEIGMHPLAPSATLTPDNPEFWEVTA